VAFLEQALHMKGFEHKFCEFIASFVQEGSFGIKVKNDIGHYF
jgi:hypothetical protein